MSLAKKKNMSHMTIVTCGLFSCAVVFVLCAQDSVVTKKQPQMVSTQGDFCAVP